MTPDKTDDQQAIDAIQYHIDATSERIKLAELDLVNAKLLIDAGYKPFTSLYWDAVDVSDTGLISPEVSDAEVYFLNKPPIAIANYIAMIENAIRMMSGNNDILKNELAKALAASAAKPKELTLVAGTDYSEVKEEAKQ